MLYFLHGVTYDVRFVADFLIERCLLDKLLPDPELDSERGVTSSAGDRGMCCDPPGVLLKNELRVSPPPTPTQPSVTLNESELSNELWIVL